MLWLPYPTMLENYSPVAVSDNSALALERALLETDRQQAAAHLAEAMVADAWFCRWVSGWPCTTRGETIAELAGWFSERMIEFLSPRSSFVINNPHPPANWVRPQEGEAADYAAQAASIRQQARSSTQSIDLPSCPQYLATLLTAAAVANSQTELELYYLAVHPDVEWRLPRLTYRLADLADLEEEFAAMLQSAKLDAMKELAYGASHEVNNPLANISGRAQTLLRDEKDPRRRRLLEAIDTQALRAHEMISDLMLFARPPAVDRQNCDLGSLIQSAANELGELAEQGQVTIDTSLPELPVAISVDSTQITVAVKALVQNAIEAIGHGGKIYIELLHQPDKTHITITDNGPGMSEHERKHLFDPFFSGREAGRGLGFGLSKCWRIVTEHGGTMQVETPEAGGAAFTISLPNNAPTRPSLSPQER